MLNSESRAGKRPTATKFRVTKSMLCAGRQYEPGDLLEVNVGPADHAVTEDVATILWRQRYMDEADITAPPPKSEPILPMPQPKAARSR